MQPNIIVFMTDHQRGDTLLPGSPVIAPYAQAFREQAVTFSRAYCPAPHCCPSRASFFTGLYPTEHGVWNNVNVSNTLSRDLFEGTRVFGQDLQQAGYDCWLSGKWHISAQQGPECFGFKRLYHPNSYRTFPHVQDASEWTWYGHPGVTYDRGDELRQEGEIIRPGYPHYTQYGVDEDPFGDSTVVQAAVDKLRTLTPDSKPFFLFVGPLGPHDPYFLPQRFLNLYDPDSIALPESFWDTMEDKPALYRRTRQQFSQLTPREQRECIRHFYAFCSYEDWLFGQVWEAAKAQGLMENTVLLYLSDHGDYIGSHGLWTKGLPCFEEAYHICALVGGAGVVQPGRIETARVSITDFAPTFTELAGAPSRPFSGQSLVPFLRGETPSDWRQITCTQTNGNEVYGIQRAVWNDEWKYVFNTFDFDELYNLREDPLELHNLLHPFPRPEHSPYAGVVKEMSRMLWQFAKEHGDNCVNPYIMTAFAPYGPGILYESPQK